MREEGTVLPYTDICTNCPKAMQKTHTCAYVSYIIMIRDSKNNDKFNIRCNLVTILLQQKLKKDVPYDILLQQALHEVE